MDNSSNSNNRTWWILIFAAIGLIVIFTPVQHYITIGRAQHHGIAIAIFGLGFWAETIFSLRKLSKWAVRSYISAGVLFISVGIVFFKNTWLYSNVAIQTEANIEAKGFLITVYLILAGMVTACWVKWIIEEHRGKSDSNQTQEKKDSKEIEENSN